MGQVKVSAVVPVYNEQENLEELYRLLSEQLRGLTSDLEIVFVDDGSTDGSSQLLERIADRDENVAVVELLRNFGQNGAMWAGIDNAGGDLIVTMDADLQYDPRDIQELLGAVCENHPLVIGRRRRRRSSAVRACGSALYCRLMRLLLGGAFPEDATSFRAFRREVVASLGRGRDRGLSFSLLAARAHIPFKQLTVEHQKRRAGRSKYSLWKLARLGVENITGATRFFLYAAAALLIISILALRYTFFALAGIVLSLAIIAAYLHHFVRVRASGPLYEIMRIYRSK